jgi:hypothetical protein
MSSENVDMKQVLSAVEALREQVAGLSDRVAALETTGASVSSLENEAEREELVATISAAIAAYLGVKPRIRQIRLLGSGSWALHGRASIQASHKLAIPDR